MEHKWKGELICYVSHWVCMAPAKPVIRNRRKECKHGIRPNSKLITKIIRHLDGVAGSTTCVVIKQEAQAQNLLSGIIVGPRSALAVTLCVFPCLHEHHHSCLSAASMTCVWPVFS